MYTDMHDNDNRRWNAAEWQTWRTYISAQDARIQELRVRHRQSGSRII